MRKVEERSNGTNEEVQQVFEYDCMYAISFFRVPVRQANICQSSPAQLFSASLIISTLHMRRRVRVLGLMDWGGIWGDEGRCRGFSPPRPACKATLAPRPPPLRPPPLPIISVGCAGTQACKYTSRALQRVLQKRKRARSPTLAHALPRTAFAACSLPRLPSLATCCALLYSGPSSILDDTVANGQTDRLTY